MVRSRILFLAVLVAAFLLSAMSVFARGGVEVSLTAGAKSFSEEKQVTVDVTITNTGRSAVKLLKWYTPIDGLEEPIFRVSLDGREVEFVGPHYKRPEPTEHDFFVLRGGESVTRTVDLSLYYDMSLTGTYEVAYDASKFERARNSRGALDLDGKASNSVAFFVEGRAVKVPEPSFPEAVTAGTTFTRCTTTQQSGAATARTNAATYADVALSYLSAGTTGPRYTTWFGAYTSARYATVKNNFTNIANAMNTAPVNINCGCKKTYYAYVYPTQPYTIYVCKAFWTAPALGTDSKAGTLIHEMSHFNIVAGTDDWVYGQAGAKNLAITNPANAVDNADSHEYFAENTPAQN